MKALVLEKVHQLSLRDFPIEETLGPDDVKIAVKVVGICGSDIHYYEKGAIGPFVVREPMILGHEAAGQVVEVGKNVRTLKAGDRVCMEPGIPDPGSKAARLGFYNLDPSVRFWATPPIHGCLRETVVHPASFTFRLPDSLSYGEGAIVEPLAIGMHAANKAAIRPGDVAVVTGAGTIGMVTTLAILASGCSKVILTDVRQEKLEIAKGFGPVVIVNVARQNLQEIVMQETGGWGADLVFEASGSEKVYSTLFDLLCPGGKVVLIGMPGGPVPVDIVAAQAKEARIETIFRYANVYERAVALMTSGKIDVTPLITDVYAMADSVAAYEYACRMKPSSVKVQISLE
jgi:D-xylulose reductase